MPLRSNFIIVLLAFLFLGIALWMPRTTLHPQSKERSFTPADKWRVIWRAKKEKRMSGIIRADQPDEFFKLRNELRTRYNEKVPGYRPGYRQHEYDMIRQSSSTARTQALSFIERGPANVPGRTRAIVVDPDDVSHQTWIVGSVGGGIWKTTDGGATWTNKTITAPNLAISWLVMAPSNHNVIYAGTGEGWGASTGFIKGGGIYKSNDRGETWNLLPSTINSSDFQMVNRLIVDPGNENIVLAATSNDPLNAVAFTSGIFKSTDGGTTWTKKFSSPSWSQQLITNPKNFNTLYASVRGFGVWKSTDAGETWTESSFGLNPDGRTELAISPIDTSRIFASSQGSLSGTGSDLYISDDGGATWNVLTEINSGTDEDFLGGQGWYNNTIMADPFDADVVYVGGVNIWRFTLQPGTQVFNNQFIGAAENKTKSFMTLVNFGAQYYGGRVDPGTDSTVNFVSVEVRFGPDSLGGHLHQMAHRFTVPDGQGSGVPAANYSYQDYVDVPFEVWDVTNNRQLMVSFRDQQKDSVFNLLPLNTDNADWANNSREYIFISSIDYNPSAPDISMTKNGGQESQELYFFWPRLTDGASWDSTTLPDSKFVISFGSVVKRLKETTNVSDAYNEFGNKNPFLQGTGSLSVGGLHPDHHNLVPIIWDSLANTYQIIDTNDGGVYSSNVSTTPGISNGDWTAVGRGYNTGQFYSVDKAPGEDRYLGGLQDNGSWFTPQGSSGSSTTIYQRANSGDGFGSVWNYRDPNKMLTSSQFNDINVSMNGGVTFSLGTAGLADKGVNNAPFLTKLESSNSDPDIVFAVGSRGVWRTDNFASLWHLAAIDSLWAVGSFTEVKISAANVNIVWAGTGMITSNQQDILNLHVSTDGGKTFTPTRNDTSVVLGPISGIATHPLLDSTAFAMFSFAQGPKVLRTDNLGKSWRDLSGFGTNSTSTNGFPDVAVYDLLVMPFDTSMLWAGTEIGIVESTDDGSSWHLLNSDMPAASIWQMRIVDDQIVIATHGRGIWSVTVPELPPHVYVPSISSASSSLQGNLILHLDAESAYDSMQLFIDNSLFASISQSSGKGMVELVTNYTTPTGTAMIRAFRNGLHYVSHPFQFNLESFANAAMSYENDFNTSNDDFFGIGFAQESLSGFNSIAIHTTHPMKPNSSLFYTLKTPIVVRAENALINFKEVAIVEPGEPGSQPGEAAFNDFVVVQGSKDGITWTDLDDPYDASVFPEWTTANNTQKPGLANMLRFKSIDMLNTFTAGDTLLIRFFASTNATTDSWGWVIDDLRIQTDNVITGIIEDPGNPMVAVYPNPVTDDRIHIKLQTSGTGLLHVNLLDLQGKIVVSKRYSLQGASFEKDLFMPGNLPNGIYHLQVADGQNLKVIKILVHR